MKLKSIIILIGIVSCVFANDVFAGSYKKEELMALYGGPAYWRMCRQTNAGIDRADVYANGANPCIGKATKSSNYPDTGVCSNDPGAHKLGLQVTAKDHGDEYGRIVLVAKDANATGVYFCPMSIIAGNKKKDSSFTGYYYAKGPCFWVCKPGYHGTDCTKSPAEEVSYCDLSNIRRINYEEATIADPTVATNIENQVVSIAMGATDKCTSDYPQEHDLIFIVTHFLGKDHEIKHGVKAAPYMVRARHDGAGSKNSELDSWIELYPATTQQYNYDVDAQPILLCSPGYKPNTANTDCVPINEELCKAKNWCRGWDNAKFDADAMMLKSVDNGLNLENKGGNNHDRGGSEVCAQWRCKDTTKALLAAGSAECVDCVINAKDGINPIDGTCVHCPTGKIFDENASGYCADTVSKTKTQLKYGDGSKNDSIDKQCWTKESEEYQSCVIGAN